MTEQNQDNSGASGSEGNQTPKFEFKDNAYIIDGKKAVFESDLIAAKKSLEAQLEKQQLVHNEAIDKAKLELSTAQQSIAQLNAQIKANEDARKSGATSDDEAARIKTELEATKATVEALKTDAAKAVEFRRAAMVLKYGVPEESLKDKSMSQLDSFEEALKALGTARGGVGNYAVGGGNGGASVLSNMDRAAKILSSTPVRGTRNSDINK